MNEIELKDCEIERLRSENETLRNIKVDIDKREMTKIVIDELMSRGFIRNYSISFSNTERLLYSYNALKESIKHRQQEIQDLMNEGIPSKSKSIVVFSGNAGGHNEEEDPVESAIRGIQKSIVITKATLNYIDKIVDSFKDDTYYKIIELKYYKGKTLEQIAEILDCDTKTVGNNRKRLIEQIRVLLIPNLYVNELIRS